MPLTELTPVDTRPLFRPVSTSLVALLRGLQSSDWERPTVTGGWKVRDIAAHLVDVMFRRVSFHRDRMVPPPPPKPIRSDRDFVEFINWLNAGWITASKRFSPRVLTDLLERASTDLSDWFEALPLEEPALFGVSWAGEQASEGWFDIGREFTEIWHHQQQIRMAVGAPSLAGPRYLAAVLAISMRVLPHAFRDVRADDGESVLIDVSGPAGARWTLTRGDQGWRLSGGEPPSPTTRIRTSDDTAWKLLYNALPDSEAREAVIVEGRQELAGPFLRARSVVV